MQAEIWYLGHSGFAVKTSEHFLLFDYSIDAPKGGKLADGVIDPEELKGQRVTVFSSHSHPDHFNPCILEWKKDLPGIQYVLSEDIHTRADALMVSPDKTYQLEGLEIRTLNSTDLGVAFLVKTDGLCIYHAGDLNWWHWEGEPDKENRAMAARYCHEVDRMCGEKIDIAFAPVDPRLERAYFWGLDYLMRKVSVQAVFPMHFWENFSIFPQLNQEPACSEYRSRITNLTHRGQKILF